MPKRTDLRKILLIGSGPIVIGQGCEFDYSGTQACKALRAEGYEVVLVNSNPATIMTDPATADRTYVEPLTPESLEAILGRERPDALLPTLGGQTALNLAMDLYRRGALGRLGVELIGANAASIDRAEDRQKFKDAMLAIGLDLPRSGTAHSLDEARAVAAAIGAWPLIVRPAFTLGGTGGGIAHSPEDLDRIAQAGLDASPTAEILIEESLLGWKETARATPSSSAPSRTSTPWACTPATPSPSPPSRPSPTPNTRPCATTPSPSCAPSASPPAAPTSSGASTPAPAAASSSR